MRKLKLFVVWLSCLKNTLQDPNFLSFKMFPKTFVFAFYTQEIIELQFIYFFRLFIILFKLLTSTLNKWNKLFTQLIVFIILVLVIVFLVIVFLIFFLVDFFCFLFCGDGLYGNGHVEVFFFL